MPNTVITALIIPQIFPTLGAEQNSYRSGGCHLMNEATSPLMRCNRPIDQVIDKLYGLTEEEMPIVKGRNH
ncbi:MAG: hypothetical protein OHK0012_08400 [Synechococcales cyanobacterium]